MKRALILLATLPLFFMSCTDKKAEAEKKKEIEITQQIESVEKDLENVVDDVEKEAKEIEAALNELDNL
jgi:iron only hydrogenase large subunit-like protein